MNSIADAMAKFASRFANRGLGARWAIVGSTQEPSNGTLTMSFDMKGGGTISREWSGPYTEIVAAIEIEGAEMDLQAKQHGQ